MATLNLPAGLPARSPIRVKFAISRDGRLSVTATDLTGGGSIDVDFETEAVMNAERRRGALLGPPAPERLLIREDLLPVPRDRAHPG